MDDSRATPRSRRLAISALGGLLMLVAVVGVGWTHEYALKLFDDGWSSSEFLVPEYENRSRVHFFRCGLFAIVGLVLFAHGLRLGLPRTPISKQDS